MMFAIIRTGGKQYKVAPDTYLQVEKLDAEVGAKIQISEVLMVSDGTTTTVGAPLVSGAVVTAEILEQGRGEKSDYFQKTPSSKLSSEKWSPPIADHHQNHGHQSRLRSSRHTRKDLNYGTQESWR